MSRGSYTSTQSDDTDSDSDTDSRDSSDDDSSAAPPRTPPRRRPSFLWLVVAALVVVLIALGVLAATRSSFFSSTDASEPAVTASADTSQKAGSSGAAHTTSASGTPSKQDQNAAGSPSPGKTSGSSTTSPAKASGSSTASAPSSTRKVFAHVLQGLSQDTTAEEWASDIALAKAAGIDGFAMNVGHDETDAVQMPLVFKTAEEAGDFVLFFSFDCNHFNTEGSSEIIVSEYLVPYALKDVYYKVEGAAFVSTFAGDNAATYLDGNSDISATWSALISSAKAQSPSIPVYFVPCPLGDSKTILDLYDGVMRWFAWPLDNSAPSIESDDAFIKATRAKNQTYLAPIGAFFFAHYNAETNYVFKSDDWLLPTHYGQVIAMETQPEWIEVNSTFDHTPILTLSSYYNRWYKTGTAPSIATETLIWWYRPHPTAATASNDALDRPADVEWLEDNIYAAVLIPEGSSASSLVFTTGGTAQEGQPVSAGVNLVMTAFAVGAQSIALLDGSGNSILSGDGWAITDTPETYNYNYWCGILPADASPSTMLGS